jgi:hypothetical protein
MRRRGESLSQAARAEHTAARTVRKVIGKQLKRNASGHYSATRGDRLRRDLNVLGFDGYHSVVVRSSKLAQLSADHLVAVGRFLRTGDFEWLKPFVGKRVGGVELLTDPDRLGVLADAGSVRLANGDLNSLATLTRRVCGPRSRSREADCKSPDRCQHNDGNLFPRRA